MTVLNDPIARLACLILAMALGWSVNGAGLGCSLALVVVMVYWTGREGMRQTSRLASLGAECASLRAELRASEDSRHRIIDFALDGAVTTDREGRVLTWNRRAETLFGRTLQEVKGRPLHSLILPPSEHDAYLATLRNLQRPERQSQPVERRETSALYRDGQEFTVELTILSTGLACEAGAFLMFIRDISDRRAAAEQMRMAKESAESASRAKSEFLANMSHELRTPMNSVIGMADLLKTTNLDVQQREFVDNLRRGADHLMGIIGDVLDLSRIEAGKLSLTRMEFDVRATVGDVMGLLAYRARDRGLSLEIQCSEDVPARLCGDEGRVRQILTNLVANAIKFTESGRVVVALNCIERLPGQVILRFRVDDSGIGIDEETLGRLFQKFTQADGSTTRRYGGTGLGLAICRQLVELMGGRLGATSTPSKGSSFWFEIPLSVAAPPLPPDTSSPSRSHAAAATGAAQSTGAIEPSTPKPDAVSPSKVRDAVGLGAAPTLSDLAPGARVLVVDDNQMNLLLLRRILERMGCAVDQADGGRLALTLVESNRYEVVFLDCQMPEMDGYEVVRRIRLRPGRPDVGSPGYVPVVGVTAGALPGDRDKCLNAGMDDYIPKPISLEVIAAALTRWRTVNEQRSLEKP